MTKFFTNNTICEYLLSLIEKKAEFEKFLMFLHPHLSLLFVNLSKGMICGTLTKLFTQINRQTAWNIFFASVHHCNNSAIDIL